MQGIGSEWIIEDIQHYLPKAAPFVVCALITWLAVRISTHLSLGFIQFWLVRRDPARRSRFGAHNGNAGSIAIRNQTAFSLWRYKSPGWFIKAITRRRRLIERLGQHLERQSIPQRRRFYLGGRDLLRPTIKGLMRREFSAKQDGPFPIIRTREGAINRPSIEEEEVGGVGENGGKLTLVVGREGRN